MRVVTYIILLLVAATTAFASPTIDGQKDPQAQGSNNAFATKLLQKLFLGPFDKIMKPSIDSASIRRLANADTTRETRIVGLRGYGDYYKLILDVGEDQRYLDIAAYNLLGKRVLEVYSGPEKAQKGRDYYLNVSNLPKGIYICVVQGDNFRIPEKFMVSR